MNLITENSRGFDFDLSLLAKDGTININESKTPLAHVHAGSFRRIFLHAQLQKWLSDLGYKVVFLIGNDDYDPYDYFPNYFNAEQKKRYGVFLGHPLCSVPAPVSGGSYADYYFNEMVEILHKNFGITVVTYKTSELYRQGVFDDGIKLVITNLNKLNEIYESMTGVKSKFNERPLQIICPKCGNMRTTRILSYKGEKVEIICKDYVLRKVKFIGCGFSGWVSPYKGNGRLFWKLEWPIRWYYMKIGIEGSRKDQNSDLGARKFAEAVFKVLFNKNPPNNLPYDFCYVRSEHSSQINRFGISATEALKFLTPQLFFELLTKPRSVQPIDMDLESEQMLKIYEDYSNKVFGDKDSQLFNRILEDVRFDLQTKWPVEQNLLAKCLHHYLHISQAEGAWFLDLTKKHCNKTEQDFLARLMNGLENVPDWQSSNLQYKFGEIVANSNLTLHNACLIIYRLFINRQAGPRIGVLFEKIGRERLLKYLKSC